ncbi:MAG: TSUP family transporter [Clostridia bacterium]|nr:TSUP family transporter [Clostridia bacterium]
MTLTPLHFLIVCPLVGLAGFIDSIAGGGGLISLPAYLLSGLPVHTSIATNKLSSSMGTAVSTYKYARSGYINWRLAVFCVVSALAGSAIGARIALLISDKVFRLLMLIILPLIAAYVMKKKDIFAEDGRSELPFVKSVLFATAIAFSIGMYDGFYGPGTGTFLLLLLTRFAHMDVRHANGITKVINLSSNIGSLTVYLFSGQVLLPLGLAAAAFSIAGNYFGSRCFTKKGAAIARPVILIVLAVFFVKTVLEMAGIM